MGHLFKGVEDWQHDSIIANKRDEWYHYSFGYLKAAEIIESDLIKNPIDRDFLIYPLIYLYRHYLEIVMKDIIIITNKLLGYSGFTPKGGHDLMRLWNESQNILKEFYDDYPEPASSIEEKIKEFYNVDIKSDNFRYPIDKKGDFSLNSIEVINYINFGDSFREIKDYMEEIASGLYVARAEIEFSKKASKR